MCKAFALYLVATMMLIVGMVVVGNGFAPGGALMGGALGVSYWSGWKSRAASQEPKP